MATSTVVPLLDGSAAVVDVGRSAAAAAGLVDDDLPVGRVDEADPQPRRPSASRSRGRALGVDADQEPLGVEAEPDALEQAPATPAPSCRARCRRRSGAALIHSK